MAFYYVNRNPQADGFHEVHIDNGLCPYPPDLENRIPLGHHHSCTSALTAARAYYWQVDGCYWCNAYCHTR